MSGLLQVSLFPDETLPSWVARLARANGKLSAYSFCGDIGVDFAGMMVGRSSEIEMLGALTGHVAEDLMEHTLVFEPGHYVRLAGQTISKKLMRKHQLAFCPQCFAEDDVRHGGDLDTRRYWRKSWLLNDMWACPTHQCRIVALPPHDRMRDLCQVLDRNSDTIADHLQSPIKAQSSFVDRFIWARCSGQYSHGDLLDQLELGVAIHTARLLGIALIHGAKQAVTQLTDEQINSATDCGLCVLRSGAEEVHEALDKIIDSRSCGIHAYGLLSALAFQRADDRYKALTDIILLHASNRSVVRSKWMEDRAQTWTSASQVAKITNFSKDQVRRRLWELGITGTLNSENVPASVVDMFTGDATDFVRSKVGCEIIGCDKEMFDSLVEYGLIKRAFLPTRKSGARSFQGLFKRSELIALRQSVEKKAFSQKSDGMITLRKAARRTGLPKATIIARILSGEYTGVALSGKRLMADNVMVDFRELDPQEDCVTAMEATRLLDIRSDAFAKLLGHGVIPHREVRGLRQFPRKIIHRRDIEAFAKKYVSIAQLVKQTGLDRNIINARMRSRNIRPVFPAAEFRVALILRSNAAKLLDGTPADVKV